ncbi:uncharacterized protein LTR77_007607 [Saxophila tyrrhenica]|uniref:Uncharacterized protein n=1 Tax=Saxophila tyrrhenica TaxID=1690608 RepID=A0AAV9P378_9PEZI|nr:hypothetical protein LTR77_007607 [Saxophila tyrrhenica]
MEQIPLLQLGQASHQEPGGPHQHSMQEATAWTSSGPGSIAFTEGPSRLIEVKDGSKTCVAILPDETFGKQLLQLTAENLAKRKADDQGYDRLCSLDRRLTNIALDIAHLCEKIDAWTDFGARQHREKTPALRQELSSLRRQQALLESKRQTTDQAWDTRVHEHVLNVDGLFSTLNSVFVASKVVEPDVEKEDDCSSQSTEHMWENRHSAKTYEALHGPIGKGPQEKKNIINNYRSAKAALDDAEDCLWDRGAIFDMMAEERRQKELVGEEQSETLTEFGLRLLFITSHWTGAVREAEAEMDAAKAAAMAAGVQIPGSITSRFVDDIDDVDKVKGGDAVHPSFNREAVTRWLESVPTQEPGADLLDAEEEALENVERDTWDAPSVEL